MYKNLHVLLLLIGLLSTTCLPAQNNPECAGDCSCEISGRILDAATEEYLPLAAIQIKGTDIGISASKTGEFVLKGLCNSEFDLVVSYIGYKTIIHHHDIHHPYLEVKLAPEELTLESVVVEAQRSVSGLATVLEYKLSTEELTDVKHESLGNILGTIAGVSTLKTGQNVVKPVIHGLHSNRVLIVNNGIRHEGQGWGREHAPEIDPAMVDRITIIKGASAVKYGPNALGGVIVVNPPTLELSSHLHGEATLQGESNGKALDGTILVQKGYKRFALIAQMAGRKQGDLHTPDYLLTNTGMKEYSLLLGSRYHTEKVNVYLYFSHFDQELGILRSSVTGNLEDLATAINSGQPLIQQPFSRAINNPKQEVGHSMFKVATDYTLKNSKMQFQYAWQSNKRQEFDVRRGTNNNRPSIDLELSTHIAEIEWVHPEVNHWTGSMGLQWLYQDNNNLPGTNTIPFIPNYNTSRFGWFISESNTVGKTVYEMGIRYDYQHSSIRGRDAGNAIYIHSIDFSSISGIAGINYSINDHAAFRSNIATAWRPPNIAELYAYGKHGFVSEYGFWRFNSDVSEEIRTSEILDMQSKPVDSEIGVKWINNYTMNQRMFQVDITGYINYIYNYIYNRPAGITNTVRGAFPYFVYEQGNSLFYGIDATVIKDHGTHWGSQITGTYLRAENMETKDKIVGIPANRMSYRLTFQTNKWRLEEFRVKWGTSYTFRQYNAPRTITPEQILAVSGEGTDPFSDNDRVFDFKAAPDGYMLMHLDIEGTYKKFIVGIRFDNLLNTRYREYTDLMRYYADQTGLNMAISVKYQL